MCECVCLLFSRLQTKLFPSSSFKHFPSLQLPFRLFFPSWPLALSYFPALSFRNFTLSFFYLRYIFLLLRKHSVLSLYHFQITRHEQILVWLFVLVICSERLQSVFVKCSGVANPSSGCICSLLLVCSHHWHFPSNLTLCFFFSSSSAYFHSSPLLSHSHQEAQVASVAHFVYFDVVLFISLSLSSCHLTSPLFCIVMVLLAPSTQTLVL